MKANTALGFALAGVSLWLLQSEEAGQRMRRIAQACALAVACLGLLTISQYLFGWDLGIDQLLFWDPQTDPEISNPGRMAPATALNFLMLGAALLLLDARHRPGIFQLPAIMVGLVAFLALLGYLYDPQALYAVAPYAGMALHTAALFFVLFLGLLFARPTLGLMRVVSTDNLGGVLARRLLPAAMVIPPALAWLRLLGERAGFYGLEFGLALFALSNVLVFSIVIWLVSKTINTLDTERQQSETRYRELFQAAPDPVLVVNQAGQIVSANAQTCVLFGYSLEELLGNSVETLIPGRFRTKHLKHRAGYVMDPRTRPMGLGLDLYARHKDGREVPVEISLSPLKIEGGVVITAIIRDITERKLAEEKLKKAAEELERSNKELEQFAYVASHDLQEPLRMVSSFTQLLARRYKDKLDADADDFIAYAVDGANRMQRLISDLLMYSRVGTRGRPFEPCDLHSILGEVLVNLQPTIGESHAIITNDGLPAVMADPTQLVQLFQNLISNAVRFRGDDAPRIHISVQEKPAEWLFSVRDNGIGIAPEYRERIFAIFQRLHPQSHAQGTGIGLAICKRIVERHGGKLWVESEPGRGSTFYFTISKGKGEQRL